MSPHGQSKSTQDHFTDYYVRIVLPLKQFSFSQCLPFDIFTVSDHIPTWRGLSQVTEPVLAGWLSWDPHSKPPSLSVCLPLAADDHTYRYYF